MQRNVPLFDCPDKEIELTYFFRWWTYRKHLRQTPEGFVVTEFLPNVPWAGKFNTISCAAGHHFYEGRWIADPRYLTDYATFWFRGGGEPRRYSFWAADALFANHLVHQNTSMLTNLLPDLVKNFEAWEKTNRGAKTCRISHARRACTKPQRAIRRVHRVKVHVVGHVAADLIRWHRVENIASAPQRA